MHLKDVVWVEKFRPQKLDDLILADRSVIEKFLADPMKIPSFIFASSKPGTGKTSAAKLIITILGCDSLYINSSMDRGIETIRDQIAGFARSMSSNPGVKRCVFLDEADGLTRQALDSLRSLMEEYSDNCFFILTVNNLTKIIEPIRSRCQVINFEHPNKAAIYARLETICDHEKLTVPSGDMDDLVDRYYPDMRSMIKHLQLWSIAPGVLVADVNRYEQFLGLMTARDVRGIYDTVYSGNFDILGFNRWLFARIFDKYTPANFDRCRQIAMLLADTEKAHTIEANVPVVFLANILEVMRLL